MHDFRTHNCAALRKSDVGQTARVSGWIHSKREHANALFIDLRDHYGLTQVVVYPNVDFYESLKRATVESVITVTGEVLARADEAVNENLDTGEIELRADTAVIENAAAPLPLPVAGEQDYPEEIRLRHRYLDLRRETLHKNIILRSQIIASLRRRMIEGGFMEFQTPILTASSPEGARDFLVPSRLTPGKFYARKVQTPFPRIPYKESMEKYGSDKPDLRIPFEISDVSEFFPDEALTGFGLFAKIVGGGGKVIAIPAPQAAANQSRKFFDSMDKWAKKDMQAPGLGYARLEADEDGNITSRDPVLKNFKPDHLTKLLEKMGLGAGDGIFFSAGKKNDAYKLAGAARNKVAADLDLIDKEAGFKFCWIVDFPMYEWDEDNKKVDFSHNPFSMPQGGMEALETKDPLDILAYQYDIVCNGVELSSGAIRNHKVDVMYKAFEIAGYDNATVDEEFAGMINAFKYGAPPHGGIAPGVDRIVMLLAGAENIREVILFPMNQSAQDLMMNAPSEVDSKALKELHLKLNLPIE